MLRDWLASRNPPPPARLAVRLSAALPGGAGSSGHDASVALIDAAAAILRQTTAEISDQRNRSTALDLLAADALITYAVEAAAEDCEGFAAQTAEMLSRLSSVAIGSTETP